jgi:hypothetical protein
MRQEKASIMDARKNHWMAIWPKGLPEKTPLPSVGESRGSFSTWVRYAKIETATNQPLPPPRAMVRPEVMISRR